MKSFGVDGACHIFVELWPDSQPWPGSDYKPDWRKVIPLAVSGRAVITFEPPSQDVPDVKLIPLFGGNDQQPQDGGPSNNRNINEEMDSDEDDTNDTTNEPIAPADFDLEHEPQDSAKKSVLQARLESYEETIDSVLRQSESIADRPDSNQRGQKRVKRKRFPKKRLRISKSQSSKRRFEQHELSHYSGADRLGGNPDGHKGLDVTVEVPRIRESSPSLEFADNFAPSVNDFEIEYSQSDPRFRTGAQYPLTPFQNHDDHNFEVEPSDEESTDCCNSPKTSNNGPTRDTLKVYVGSLYRDGNANRKNRFNNN